MLKRWSPPRLLWSYVEQLYRFESDGNLCCFSFVEGIVTKLWRDVHWIFLENPLALSQLFPFTSKQLRNSSPWQACRHIHTYPSNLRQSLFEPNKVQRIINNWWDLINYSYTSAPGSFVLMSTVAGKNVMMELTGSIKLLLLWKRRITTEREKRRGKNAFK